MPETIAVSGGPGKPEDRYGKIIIAGRAQTGKTSLARRLSDETGLPVLKTCTTRPKRSPDEDTYHFYSIEEAGKITPEQKLFPTVAVDGFERWTDRSDFLAAGIAVLDPTAISDAVRLWQSQGYRVTVIYCELSDEERRTRWMKAIAKDDGSDWYEVLEGFEHRERTERPMFELLEDTIRQIDSMDNADALLYPNLPPERRTVCNEDRLLVYRPLDASMQDRIVRNFMSGQDAEARLKYRSFQAGSDLVLATDSYTYDQWAALCQALGLLPERTVQIIIAKPVVKTFHGDACECSFLQDQKGE